MTDLEIVLLDLLRNHTDPEQAMIIAIKIISDFLKQS